MRTYKMKYISISIFFLGIFFTASGQENLTLEKAISLGLENNFQIKIADQFIKIAENNNTWARAGRTPIVDLNGSLNNTLTLDNNPASFLRGTFYTGSLGANVGASYVLYAGGRIGIQKEQLQIATTQEKINKQTNINELIRDIYQRYYNVLLQVERLNVLNSNFALSKDRLVYEQTKREYGASNTYNLIQFENGALTDSINVVNQMQLIDISKRNLYTVLSIEGMPDYTFEDGLGVIPEEIERDALQRQLDEDNYTLKSLEILASLNKLNTQLAKAAQKPTISLNASVGGSENAFQFFAEDPNTGEQYPFNFNNRFNANVGAQATWNLYDGNVRKTDVQNARLQEEIDVFSLAEARLSISNQLDILIDNYNNQRDLLFLADEQIRLSERNLEITEERFKAGQVTSLDFRNVQTQYLNAAFNKVNAIYDLIVSKSEIDFLVGTFGE